MYYPSSENKGADQLRSNRKADLHLCFGICKKPVFSYRGSPVLGLAERHLRVKCIIDYDYVLTVHSTLYRLLKCQNHEGI